MSQPYAIVIGLDSVTGLQTARILARRGVPVIGIARDPGHPCCRTNVCERILFCQTANEDLIQTLGLLGPDFKSKAVLFPCTDMSVLMISRHREILDAWYHVVLPEPYVVELLLDKCSFSAYAQEKGLPIPPTFVLYSGADAKRAAGGLRFPCILKPSLKTPKWEKYTKAKAFRASSAADLLVLFERCSRRAEALIAQEWIEGSDTHLYTCNCYFNRESQPVVSFVTRKLRQWPPDTGIGCLAEECRNDTVQDETIRLFRQVRLRGLGYLEVKHEARSGRYFIVEPNVGRPTGRSVMAEAAGVELLYSQYCDAVGWPLPANRKKTYPDVKWIHFRRDLQSAARQWWRGDLTLPEWLRSWRGLTIEALFSWNDPAPFFADFLKAFRLPFSRRGRFTPAASVFPLTTSPGEQSPRLARRSLMEAQASTPAVIDYDVHGLVGIRLVNPSPGDAAAVARQLGRLQCHLARRPDITVRFVEHLPTSQLCSVEMGQNGFTEDGFFVLRSSKGEAKARIPFDRIGQPCEILCQSGLRSVPLLLAIVNLTALKKGYVALHASAFLYQGAGVLVTGWAKGGKTEALLAFAEHGARYVGDEWILLSADGEKMCGIPEFIRLWDWHLDELPRVRRRANPRSLLFFRGVRWLDRAQRLVNGRWGVLREALPALKRQLNVQLDPQVVFGAGSPLTARPEKLFLMMSHQNPRVVVEPADPVAIARRMAASVRYEQWPLFSNYLAYTFAFPERKNLFLEQAPELQQQLLCRALADKEAYTVCHPYPCSLEGLFQGMRPFCELAVNEQCVSA